MLQQVASTLLEAPDPTAWSLAEADIEPLFSQFLPLLARVYLRYADYIDNTQECAACVIKPYRVSRSLPSSTHLV